MYIPEGVALPLSQDNERADWIAGAGVAIRF